MHSFPMLFPPRPALTTESAGARFAGALWPTFALASAAILAVGLWASGEVGRQRAVGALAEATRTDARLSVALTRTILEKYRALPFVLSSDGMIAADLSAGDAPALDRLNRKLETLAAGTRAAVIYLVAMDGIAVSASNWRDEASFVGNDYGFRPYFRGALDDGTAEHFALGTVSRRPGLYLSQRIDGPDGPLGVVVVKVEFDDLEAEWASGGKPTYVVDGRGIVLVTSIPSWRFMTLGDIPPARRAGIRESLQFGEAPLTPLPRRVTDTEGADAEIADIVMPGEAGGAATLDVATPVPTTGWTLHRLVPLSPEIDAGVREARLVTLLALLVAIALAAILLYRRQALRRGIARERHARLELERRVAERTQALSQAHDRLAAEIGSHRATEGALQSVQQQLVQANRLAILGQVAAGVAHEINQPVATIRAYADNARTFLDRGRTGPAAENLERIAELTERIGGITEALKGLARKGRAAAEPTDIRAVVEGAVMLLRSRFSGRMDLIVLTLPAAALVVSGHRLRLEQVLINLLQNALEAVADRGDAGRVEISASDEGDAVALRVRDNGPGFPPGIRENLFSPFNTSKDAGLGLGLVISKDIVADYGGRIEVETGDDGTCFTVSLRKA
ncbi:sensor histidine kinase [Ensifer soli]|uniref:sensor histidine kinase n=1 Tax=Ciceribacter sp. sgz301302 TaxID=3342379 RepID=UPI0035BAA9B6